MTAVVSPLSALVKVIPLFLLKLWLACTSYLLRLGVDLAILLWTMSYFMLSKQQWISLFDLVWRVYLFLYLSVRVVVLAARCVHFGVLGGIGIKDTIHVIPPKIRQTNYLPKNF